MTRDPADGLSTTPAGPHGPDSVATDSRTLNLVSAGILLAAAIVVTVIVLTHPALLGPVVTSSADRIIPIAQVNVGVAVIVPLALGIAIHLLSAHTAPHSAEALGPIRWFERSLSASITLFLLAQLNGIRELGTLVAIYALTSALVLFAALQERAGAGQRMPAVFGAMVGIVPWGLIAWYQIVPTVLADAGPATWVRVLTIALLALVVASAVSAWRTSRETRATIVLGLLTRLTLAISVAAAVGSAAAA